jgi:hypothetical protein
MNMPRIQYAVAAVLLILLLVPNLQTASMPLSRQDLSSRFGAGFWQDPCTWDGFLAGSGAVLCAFGSVGGCLTAIGGALKAVKVDNCF